VSNLQTISAKRAVELMQAGAALVDVRD